jgi:FkbM family methyltransferase
MVARKRSNWHYVRSVLGQTWNHPSNSGRRVQALTRAVGWQVRKRFSARHRDLPYFGYRLRCYADSNSASNVVYFTERYDPTEMGFMIAYLRPGDGFIDAGANIGTYALLAASLVGPNGRIDAFEPHPVAAARCRENVELNRITTIEVHEAAVAGCAGQAEFLCTWDVSNRIKTSADQPQATQVVRTVRLDEILAGRSYALGKLDVEGFETKALSGSTSRLAAADPPVWQVEVIDHLLRKAGSSRAELFELLARYRYRLTAFDLRSAQLRELPDEFPNGGNIWAVHEDALDFVAERLAGARN